MDTDANVVIVATPRTVRQLTTELRDPRRTRPVIGVGMPLSDTQPTVKVSRLREIVDPLVRIYLIENQAMRTRLAQRIGAQLMPTHGIRIWWPRITSSSSCEDHPLIAFEGSEDTTLETFTLALEKSRPTLSSLRAQLTETTKKLAEAEQQLRAAQRQLKEAKRSASSVKAQRGENSHSALKMLNGAKLEMLAGMDDDESMHFLIFAEWLASLTATDRTTHPLHEYSFGPQFVSSIKTTRTVLPVDRVAFVCAMVACGRAKELAGLVPQPLPDVAQSRKRRDDNAKGWVCHVGAGPGAKRLIYWTHSRGHIEFDSVRGHDELGRM